MELRQYLLILRRNWIVIVTLVLVGLLVGGFTAIMTKPVYRAATQLFVATQSSGSVQDLQTGNSFIQARVSSYVKTALTPTVLEPVIATLGLDTTPQQLAKRVTASSDLSTVLISIAVEDRSPVQAAAIAQAVANSLIVAVDRLEMPTNGGDSPVKISVVTPASAPLAPSSPNMKIYLVVGLMAGLALGIVAALLRTTLDSRVRSERDLAPLTSSPVLGGIAFDADATKNPLVSNGSAHSQRAESFRQLRTNLQFAHVSHKSKTVLVTSSLPGEGKSSTATNLAIAIAESGQSVALVDADLRRPMVAKYLGLEGQAGLTTALIGQADVQDLMQPWGKNELHVLTSGRIPPNPSELLGSVEMKLLIDRLEQAFDAVIIDAPPLLPVTDSAVLAQQVGGVLLVVGCHTAKRPQIEKAISTLQLVDADVLGVVLNRVPTKGPDAYSYSYYGYSSESSKPVTRVSDHAIETNPVVEVATRDAFDDILQGRTSRRAQ
ncbi:polysaccharide biosynthesis tyrosine autokinase [Arthrobacter glacialis]|uniref:polysaccharide biosynthesis tyrosine autokinase n=1 Tax=Arthrobacter glacialis TaxID=1664 RepID=UPI000CD41EA7|nr:polysaccharide biosynthesis tyrosine autokinase [Arthrobacter glacialis]POH60797.1 chromosome partitioning protein [Arthrobacter glacialis]